MESGDLLKLWDLRESFSDNFLIWKNGFSIYLILEKDYII